MRFRPNDGRSAHWCALPLVRVAVLLAGTSALAAAAAPREAPAAPERLAAIEKQVGGRLGVAILDADSGRRLEHRAGERFAMCSTFKLLVAAAVLARVDVRQESLDRGVAYSASDLVDYSPVTREHVAAGRLPVATLCAAAVERSDNAAANLLLATLGGPAGLTRYARSLGDPHTRLDRLEPELNLNVPGDPRDTTTPAAMVGNLQRLLLGDALSPASRERLRAWLVGSTTGASRLRAGLPPDWSAGDKTGTGMNGATNDVAIAWPPGRGPVLAAVYLSDTRAPFAEREAALAAVGRVMAADPGGWTR